MHTHDREAFATCEPTAKCIHRVKKYPIGIHQRWSADGHDKLYKIGFPIWAIVDDATSKWLGAWVVPSNRMGNVIAYLWLCAVQKYGGKWIFVLLVVVFLIFSPDISTTGTSLQFATDCGSETTVVYGLVNAFR